jgi:hypothetical protein
LWSTVVTQSCRFGPGGLDDVRECTTLGCHRVSDPSSEALHVGTSASRSASASFMAASASRLDASGSSIHRRRFSGVVLGRARSDRAAGSSGA